MIDANIGNPATATERPCELQPGLNRLWWDLKTDRSSEIHLRTPPLYVPDFPMGPQGWRPAPELRPMSLTVPPGTFVAKLTIGNKDYGEQRLNVLKDPYSAGSTGDIDSQTQFVTKLRDRCDGCIDLRFT